MEPERNEYKDVRGKKVENDTNIEGLVQCNIYEQKRKDKITNGADRMTELPQTPDKRSVSVLMELDKAKTQEQKTGSWNGIMIVNRTVISELKW
ncbi:MAG: hypothetical protein EZS28_052642, partial [Streblomastix strix]